MSLSDVIALNNHAAFHVESNRTREAVDLFRSALTSLKMQCHREVQAVHAEFAIEGRSTFPRAATVKDPPLRRRDAIDCGKDEFDDMTDDDVAPGRCVSHFLKVSYAARFPSNLASSMNHGHDSYLSIFDRVFSMSQEPASQDLVAAVVLFNIAVVRHTTGIQLGRSRLLGKAKSVYVMALNLLQGQAGKGNVPTVLLLAILNNLAELASHCHAIDEVRAYLECLRAILAEVTDLDEYTYTWFCRNAMLQEPTAAAAA